MAGVSCEGREDVGVGVLFSGGERDEGDCDRVSDSPVGVGSQLVGGVRGLVRAFGPQPGDGGATFGGWVVERTGEVGGVEAFEFGQGAGADVDMPGSRRRSHLQVTTRRGHRRPRDSYVSDHPPTLVVTVSSRLAPTSRAVTNSGISVSPSWAVACSPCSHHRPACSDFPAPRRATGTRTGHSEPQRAVPGTLPSGRAPLVAARRAQVWTNASLADYGLYGQPVARPRHGHMAWLELVRRGVSWPGNRSHPPHFVTAMLVAGNTESVIIRGRGDQVNFTTCP